MVFCIKIRVCRKYFSSLFYVFCILGLVFFILVGFRDFKGKIRVVCYFGINCVMRRFDLGFFLGVCCGFWRIWRILGWGNAWYVIMYLSMREGCVVLRIVSLEFLVKLLKLFILER